MTVDGHMLLKMLEPVIRPGSSSLPSGGVARQGNLPLEQQSFEHLLAGQMKASPAVVPSGIETDAAEAVGDTKNSKADSTGHSQGHGPLGQLARIDQIENNSLRSLMSSHAQGQLDSQMQRQSPASQMADQAAEFSEQQAAELSGDRLARTLDEFLAVD